MGFRSQVDKDRFFIWQIGVFSKYRGQEIGKKLLYEIEKAAKDTGCKITESTVDPENIPSKMFFEKNGYKNVSSKEGKTIKIKGNEAVENYYKPGRHFILFQKQLKK